MTTDQKSPTYQVFPHITIPAWLTGPGWEDASYHNDALPHSEYTRDNEKDTCLSVWVNYINPNDREDQLKDFRYLVMNDMTEEVFYKGEDESDACAIIIIVIESKANTPSPASKPSGINTIGDLKRAIAEFQANTGRGDNAPVFIPVRAFTKSYNDGPFRISFMDGGYGGMSLYVGLPEGYIISQRKKT